MRKFIKKLLRSLGYAVTRDENYNLRLKRINKKLKSESELNWWKYRYKTENNEFKNDHYEKLMLAMAQEKTDSFLKDKIVADFGCGPRGSLVWTQAPSLKIGIDVLVDQYFDTFGNTLINHNMLYVKSTEHFIPLPSEFVDVVYTMNAMDHTENFSIMSSELLRVLKKGGEFIGSFNLNEPPTACEPQTLTKAMVNEHILSKLDVKHTKIASQTANYADFFDPNALPPAENEKSFFWVRGTKL
ncbi:class I SAM-dependent methyltransferase [Odoribacter sp. OttesenSCG-928-L07]|nr:class I SAM-dependent methyltransferase [Odoribacter sp. OttesenSCG-928-L07]MDL2239177.1 class I SAM-dependent methyltransferase [Bacteroidales bacterium OttesenSCG-928-L14]MDL2240521.1 class I SAM-dependent methyltransferase [Bacteroidales bacterium OttesenSCG-928-K22]